jgi:hypothetical protein
MKRFVGIFPVSFHIEPFAKPYIGVRIFTFGALKTVDRTS